MEGRSAWSGFAFYLGWVVSVVLFPVALWRVWRMSAKHAELDPRARRKAAVAIVAAFALLAGATYAFVGFHVDNVDGIWDSFDKRVSIATKNEEFQQAVDEGRNEDVARLQANRDLYLRAHDAIEARDDDAVRTVIATRDPAVEVDDEVITNGFARKAEALESFKGVMVYLVYPGLVGVFYAPIVFAVGSSLRGNFSGSATVGFKPYPSGAAGLFLLLGAFGIPAALFAAWTLKDMADRTAEGQIAL
jgi:hypothetical protein